MPTQDFNLDTNAAPATSAKVRVGFAAGVTFLVSMVNIVLGIVSWQAISPYDYSATTLQVTAAIIIILGLLFLALGIGVVRRSKGALVTVITLYVIDALIGLLAGNVLALGIHIVLLALMIPGLSGIQQYRDAEQAARYRSMQRDSFLERDSTPIWN